jgi:hypothetical protein
MRIGLFLVVVASAGACERSGPSPQGTTSPTATAPAKKNGAEVIVGTWEAEGFIGTTPAGSASAAALNTEVSGAAAKATRITYTKEQIKIVIEGQTLASTYTVMEDAPGRCVLLNGKDTVFVEVVDDDHIVVDRRPNPIEAKMKMRRVH